MLGSRSLFCAAAVLASALAASADWLDEPINHAASMPMGPIQEDICRTRFSRLKIRSSVRCIAQSSLAGETLVAVFVEGGRLLNS